MSTRSAEPTYTITQLAQVTGVSSRTMRSWIKAGLVPAPVFRGSRTRYGRVHLLRVLAVKQLRAEFLTVPQIKRQLAAASVEDVERLAHRADTRHALGGTASPDAAAAVPATYHPPADPTYPAERWEKVVLLPGLEIHVRNEPVLRRIAQEIFTHFGPRAQ